MDDHPFRFLLAIAVGACFAGCKPPMPSAGKAHLDFRKQPVQQPVAYAGKAEAGVLFRVRIKNGPPCPSSP
jgi:hypothetical protein